MEDLFILIRQDDSKDWFLLLTRATYYCVASGTEKDIRNSVKNLKRKYKSSELFWEALKMTTNAGVPNPQAKELYKQLYKIQRGKYDYIIEEALEEEYSNIRAKKKLHKKVLSSKVSKPSSAKLALVKPHTEETVLAKKSFKRIVRKPVKAKGV